MLEAVAEEDCEIEAGDFVLIKGDRSLVVPLQKQPDHGGWIEEMAEVVFVVMDEKD